MWKELYDKEILSMFGHAMVAMLMIFYAIYWIAMHVIESSWLAGVVK